MTEEQVTIYNKLAKITDEAEQIPKNGFNEFSKYKYILAVDVVAQIKKLLISNNILFCLDEVEFNRLSKKEDGKNFHSTIKCKGTFKNLEPPYDEHTVNYYSVSADTLDKDIFKAKTNGLKYLFIQQFLLITDDWIDTEAHSEEKPITITDEQIIQLNEVLESKGYNVKGGSALKNLAKSLGFGKINDLPASLFNDALKMCNDKPEKTDV